MPVTPLHFGPGVAVKAVGGRQFSLVVFGLTQVVMDLEAVVRFAAAAHLLHGPVHSIVGATLVGLAVSSERPTTRTFDWPVSRRNWSDTIVQFFSTSGKGI